MEKALLIWIEDHAQKRIPLDTELITEKALRIYHLLMQEQPSSSTAKAKKSDFSASKGWFYGFLKKNNIRNVHIKGECASADTTAATEYPTKLAKIIDEGSYHADQVFNADETGLFWKKMPSRTYLASTERSAPGFKAAKDRVTLLFCSNASGDKILKPLMLNKAMRPRSMKGMDFEKLPVHWMSNSKAWVTKDVFQDWFENHFVPEVKSYLEGKGLEFRALLLIDNAPGHLSISHPNVQVVFLPPNTTSLIQPLDQAIISTFKKYYIKYTFRYILDSLDADNSLNVVSAWKRFSVRDCVRFIGSAVASLKPSTLNACWRPLWPGCVRPANPPPGMDEREILLLAHAVGGEGFEDMTVKDLDELLLDTAIDDEALCEFVKDTDAEDDPEKDISLLRLDEGLQMAERLADFFLTHDPHIERAVTFKNDLKYCVARYNELHKQLQKDNSDGTLNELGIPSTSAENNRSLCSGESSNEPAVQRAFEPSQDEAIDPEECNRPMPSSGSSDKSTKAERTDQPPQDEDDEAIDRMEHNQPRYISGSADKQDDQNQRMTAQRKRPRVIYDDSE